MKYLIFGGTGFLGKNLAKKLLSGNHEVCVFSRSEDTHRQVRLENPGIQSIIGDIRDYNAILNALKKINPDVVIAAQALKQINLCEEMPFEAVQTNILGTENLCNAIEEFQSSRRYENLLKFVAISTDKSARPTTLYGATKLIQERLVLSRKIPNTLINVCRYGNVLSSTGSVVPVFKKLLKENKDLPITDYRMTRFLLDISEAIELIMSALEQEDYTDFGGKIFVPRAKSARIIDLANLLIESENSISKTYEVGIRPLEKLHEIFFCDEEITRIQECNKFFIINDINDKFKYNEVKLEYSSGDPNNIMNKEELFYYLKNNKIL